MLGSLRGETPYASCLAFLMSEKSFFDTKPELFPAVSFPSHSDQVCFGGNYCRPA